MRAQEQRGREGESEWEMGMGGGNSTRSFRGTMVPGLGLCGGGV